MNLSLVMTQEVNNVPVDGYYGEKVAWFTRQQIGEALEYTNPSIAIAKIHNRHKERFEGRSALTSLVSPDGKAYETWVYNFKGILEICRWSRQPKADMVMDALYEMAESVVEKGYYTVLSAEETILALAKGLEYDHFMEDVVFPAMETQEEFTFDNLVEHYCGFPVKNMDDFVRAKHIFQETQKERKQRLSALKHSVNDFVEDRAMLRRIHQFKWGDMRNRGHYKTIKGVRWFDDFILEQLQVRA